MADEKIALKKTYATKPFHMTSVEFIIPFHNHQSLVAGLLTDIFATVVTNKYLVTLVDDGSKNRDFVSQIKTKNMPGVRVLRSDNQMGFGASVNLALRNPFPRRIPFVCIMHSDVRLRDTSWLERLGATLVEMKDSGVKMVSPRTDNPGADNPRLFWDGEKPSPDFVLEDGSLPMYCCLANRELFSKVGLFAEYPYAGVETEEFSARMRSMGYKQGVCGTSWVEHRGKGTLIDYENNNKVLEILRKARQEFASRGQNTRP